MTHSASDATTERKLILIEFPGLNNNALFSSGSRDNVLEPFIFLRSRLFEHGADLQTADDHQVSSAHAVWFWDVPAPAPTLVQRIRHRKPTRDLLGECLRAGLRERLVLFLGEPAVVAPQNDDPSRWADFGTVFTWRDDLVATMRFTKFLLPLPADVPGSPRVPFGSRRLLVNISSNKHSVHPGQLYTARRDVIRYCEQAIPKEFALYGQGWDRPGESFPSYQGAPRHKWDVLPSFRFALAYENMAALGYVTEKVFDVLRAGVVPVYLGAPNIATYVDPQAFIDRREFGSDADLVSFLRSIDEATYRRYRSAAIDYLASSRFERFLPPAFAETVISNTGLS